MSKCSPEALQQAVDSQVSSLLFFLPLLKPTNTVLLQDSARVKALLSERSFKSEWLLVTGKSSPLHKVGLFAVAWF